MTSSPLDSPKVAVIVQARMTSTRLPGKVMMKLAGETVLSHVLTRCRAIPGVDIVVCATVDGPEGDPIAEEALRLGCDVFKGSETDVLQRYYRAAKSVDADIIMRVTSDSPLLDPKICGAALQKLKATGADYITNNMPPGWPHGLDCEAFTFKWLKRAHKKAKLPSEREHVSPWIRNNPKAKKINLDGPTPSLNHYRWTLDTPEDFAMMETLFAKLPHGPEGWDWQTAKEIVDQTEGLREVNADYDPLKGLKKSLNEDEDWALTWLESTPPAEQYTNLGFTIDYEDETGRRLVSLRAQDLLPIMHWRNEQIDVLRQAKPLGPIDQRLYYENHIRPTYGEARPKQILVSYLKDGKAIGYGGLTNIDWEMKSAEVSFLVETARTRDLSLHCEDFDHFIKLLTRLAYEGLGLNRLHTETYDIRPHHIEVLEQNHFIREGCLKDHVVIEGEPTDAILHARHREPVIREAAE